MHILFVDDSPFFNAWGCPPSEQSSKQPNQAQRSVHGEPKFNQWTDVLCEKSGYFVHCTLYQSHQLPSSFSQVLYWEIPFIILAFDG